MSGLSGYDSEAVGFISVTKSDRSETCSSTQTTEFYECGSETQTTGFVDCSCGTSNEEQKRADVKEYTPGLNEFLRRVVPAVMEQLDQNDDVCNDESSDSDEEDIFNARLFQEITARSNMPGRGNGDYQTSVLDLSWSSAGNSIAISLGISQHENWCEHDGLVRIYTVKRSAGDKLVHILDITENNCITTVKYHPSVAALLAYGTVSGEVVLCNLQKAGYSNDGIQLASPSGCHGSKRVSALHWADDTLAHMFLTLQITKTGKRRGAADQVLISSGSDGTINVWQVNANTKTFQNVVCYSIDGSRKNPAPNVTCFDFVKNSPLRPSEEKVSETIFAVGTQSGRIYLCKTTDAQSIDDNVKDPVYEVLEGHSTCVLNVAFSLQKSGIFVSISIDSQLRVYDINQSSPLKVICLDVTTSNICWLPNTPCILVGLSHLDEMLRVYNMGSGKMILVDGLRGSGTVTALSVTQCGGFSRVAAGDAEGLVRIWDLPSRSFSLMPVLEY